MTECPYCGQRVRKRAPKLERDGRGRCAPAQAAPAAAAVAAEAGGDRGDRAGHPSRRDDAADRGVPGRDARAGGVGHDPARPGRRASCRASRTTPWRYLTTPFVHDSLAYQFVALVTVGIFGTLLEQRFGWFVVIFAVPGMRRRGGRRRGRRGPGAAVRRPAGLPRARRERGGARAAGGVVRRRPPSGAPRGRPRERPPGRVRDRRAARAAAPGRDRGQLVAGVTGAAAGALLGLALPMFARR